MKIRIEVMDEHGAVAEFVDTGALDALRPGKRRQLDALAGGLVAGLAEHLGWGDYHARALAIAELTRLVADEAAYRRVAERRGMLPL